MNLKTEALALAVRVLAEHTSLIRKPDAFEITLNSLFGGETYDRRIAREIEVDAKRAFDAAKRVATNHKFKKITKNY